MDSGRFGRALGIGARLAGRTLAEAAEAAAAPNPRGGAAGRVSGEAAEASRMPEPEVLSPGRERDWDRGFRAGQQTRVTTGGVRRGGQQFGEAVWRPFARASGVLWLEVTGVFFGLIALFGLQGVWTWRGAFLNGGGSAERRHLMLAVALALGFGYFCVSSFVRARRRGRGPSR